MCDAGPPGPPAGVFGDGVTATSINLRWTKGADNGRVITGYIVEGFNEHEKIWRELKTSMFTSLEESLSCTHQVHLFPQ